VKADTHHTRFPGKNVHLWLMPVLQRGSFIKVGEIYVIFYLFFLQDSPLRSGRALPFLEPQGLKRIDFKSGQVFQSC
jgi:hypothetical protein